MSALATHRPSIPVVPVVDRSTRPFSSAVNGCRRAAIDEHLSFCRRCCGEAEFAAELRSFMAAQAAEELPADARERLSATLDRLEREAS